VQSTLNVGFVGLGNMGWPMARNVARAGFPLTVRDADHARQQRFAEEHGCRVANDPSAFRTADVVVTMLPTGRIVREVMREWAGGLVQALARGSIVVDMSSSDPVGTRELAAALARNGVTVIDAPVSGGVPKAQAGTLAIMIGGDDARAIERVRPLLDSMGQKLFFTGPVGSGHAMKALNNYVAAAGYTAGAEALIVGGKFGLDPAAMVDILNASTGRNFSTEYTLKEHVVPGRFATGFALGLLAKDVAIAADLAEAIGIDAPQCRLIRQMWADAEAAMGSGSDHSVAIKRWAQANGVALDAVTRQD
jgi:3-hydroxyisobutyrate dehydrogenase